MMPRQGTVVADRYRLERKVGGGRVAAMWRVQDQITDAPCAIKLLHRSMNDHPEALARFSLEDRLSRELTGDYFPERVGSGSWHSLRYIAWRWYEGECLRSLFERTPKQDVQTVYSIVQDTCQALTLVHAAGYTHGDLKPENLFFADRAGDSSRQLKLLGFGVSSRLARPLLGSQARRTPGQVVGTPLYLSPDLILGRVPRGGQADLWALAVIVYEALTGRAPFLGSDLSEVLEAILERRAARPSSITNLPATFDVWWTQALEQQFLTPADFSSSLARALAPALRSSRTQRSASLPDRIGPAGQGLTWRSEVRTPSPLAPATLAVTGAAPELASAPANAPLAGAAASSGAAHQAKPPAATTALGGVAASASSVASAEGRPSGAPAAGPGSPPGIAARALSEAAASTGAEAEAGSTAVSAGAAASAAVSSPLAASDPARSAPDAAAERESNAPAPAAAPRRGLFAGTTVAGLGQSPLAGRAAASASLAATPAAATPAAAARAGAAPAVGAPPGPSPAPALTPAGSATAAGLGHGPDAASLMSAARAKAESSPGHARLEPPRPEPNGRASSRPDAPSAEAFAAPEPQRGPSVTSTTVAGIGPAALSLLRSRESAVAARAAAAAPVPELARAGAEAASSAAEGSEPMQGAPLRALGLGSRKTLVGIFPPAAPPPAAPSAAPHAPAAITPAAVTPAAITPAPEPVAAAIAPIQSLVISGTPCRSIDVSDDEAVDSVVPLRRLGNATVPFPRPRAASRAQRGGDMGAEALHSEIGYMPDAPPQSWRNRTSNTLRVVLTDPDHRPHLVAGLLVCSAAALVIFALGRSPVSGTGMLGQSTGSLSGRDGVATPSVEPSSASPAAPGNPATEPLGRATPEASSPVGAPSSALPQQEEGAASHGAEPARSTEPASSTAAPASSAPPPASGLRGVEVAPGLVVPQRAPPPRAMPSPLPPPAAAPRVPPASGTPASGGAPASGGTPAGVTPASPSLAAPPPRAVPPRKPGTEPPPPRPANPDFDFGI